MHAERRHSSRLTGAAATQLDTAVRRRCTVANRMPTRGRRLTESKALQVLDLRKYLSGLVWCTCSATARCS
jgi:hypothetical protein